MEHAKLVQDLEEVQSALREAQETARKANQRVNYLAKMHDALQGLMSLDPEVEIQEAPAIEPEIAPNDILAITPSISVTPTAEPNGNSYVKPRDAILKLLGEDARFWRLAEIVGEMQGRGWLDQGLKTPVEAVRAAANRLVDVEKLVEREGPSSYRLPQHASASTSREDGR